MVGQVSVSMVPSGSRTAMALVSGPRIIIPSMRAWPPMDVFFVLKFDTSFLGRRTWGDYPCGASSGRVMETVVPLSFTESSVSVPPCIRIISSATARPMPLPRRVVWPL